MHKQLKSYWCGPCAVQNALAAMGVRSSQKDIATLCGTTSDGTSEHQLLEGLETLGYPATTIATNERSKAKVDLTWGLIVGDPIILCVQDWEHWITIVAPPLGNYFMVVDPHDGRFRQTHWRTLERSWRAAARLQTGSLDTTYYAIQIKGRR